MKQLTLESRETDNIDFIYLNITEVTPEEAENVR